METYIRLFGESNQDLSKFVRDITRKREQDVADFTNLSNQFMKGRKVDKVPSASTDVSVTDNLGDFNYTATYYYILVDDSGTAAWRRISLASW